MRKVLSLLTAAECTTLLDDCLSLDNIDYGGVMPEKLIGHITHFFGKIMVGIVKLEGELKVGDQIHIKGAHTDFNMTVQSMQMEHKNIDTAKAGDEIGLKVDERVHEKDEVFLVTDS